MVKLGIWLRSIWNLYTFIKIRYFQTWKMVTVLEVLKFRDWLYVLWQRISLLFHLVVFIIFQERSWLTIILYFFTGMMKIWHVALIVFFTINGIYCQEDYSIVPPFLRWITPSRFLVIRNLLSHVIGRTASSARSLQMANTFQVSLSFVFVPIFYKAETLFFLI